MAQFDGKHWRGIIDKVVFKKRKDGKLTAQSAPVHVPQTEASKKTASIMGNASSLSGAIRACMTGLFNDNAPGTMINRLTTINRAVLQHCFDKTTQTYSFKQDSFSNMAGFEFNDASPLSNHLWVKPYLTLNDAADKLTLTIPAFEIPSQLTIPSHANYCQLEVSMGQFALFGKAEKIAGWNAIKIKKDQTQVPETQFHFDIMPGCLGVVGLGLSYYKLQHEVLTPLNNKTLNPAAIIGAIFTPGEFVLPVAVPVDGVLKSTGWTSLWKLNIKPAIPSA